MIFFLVFSLHKWNIFDKKVGKESRKSCIKRHCIKMCFNQKEVRSVFHMEILTTNLFLFTLNLVFLKLLNVIFPRSSIKTNIAGIFWGFRFSWPPVCMNTSKLVWTRPILSEHVQTCMCEGFRICLTLSKHVKHVKTQLILRTKMSGQVWTCLEKFGHVWPCLVWVQFEGAWATSAWGRSSYKRWQVTTILHRLGGE